MYHAHIQDSEKIIGFRGRCPDGEWTTDSNLYVKSWRSFLEPFEKLTGLTHFAFDPSGSFVTSDGKNTVQIPAWVIKLINEGLEKKENDNL